MASKTQEEHEEFQRSIMDTVQHYQDIQTKNQQECEEFLIRLEGQEVVDFSSQYGSESSISYVASNLAGKTFVFPSYGDYTQTCVFRTYGNWWKAAPSGKRPYQNTPDFYGEDFIEVYFAEQLYPVRIEVYETYNPGAICRILACDRSEGSNVDNSVRWVTLWCGKPVEVKQGPRIFAPRIKKVNFATNLIRLEMCHKYMDYYTELDGIKLIGTKTSPTSNPLKQNSNTEIDKDVDSICVNVKDLTLDRNCSQLLDICYFYQLPKELIHFILNFLNTTDLCRLAQTCSFMRDHCYDPLLYTDLNLQPYWNSVSNKSLQNLSQRCERLQRLNLSWLGKSGLIYSDVLASFLSECENLQMLELSACNFVDSNTLSLIVNNCRNIRGLNLSCCCNITDFSAFSVFTLPKLKSLNLYRTKVDVPSLVAIIKNSPELEHLNVSSCLQLDSNINLVLSHLGQCCQRLKSLDLWRMRKVNSTGLAHISNNCPLLEELDVGWCIELKSYSQCFIQLAEKCGNLKKVFMTANRTVMDADLLSLASHCPNMEQVDILGTRDVTKKSISVLLEKCKKLIFLDLSFCVGISSEDVWAWRTQYPNVAIKKSFQHVSTSS